MARPRVGPHHDLVFADTQHQGDFGAQRLRVLAVGMNRHRAIGFDIGQRYRGADRRMFEVGQEIGALVRFGGDGGDIALGGALARRHFAPVDLVLQMVKQVVRTGQALPWRPFRIGGDSLRGLHGLPFIARHNRHQIAQYHDAHAREAGGIDLARRDQLGAQRFGMDRAGVQHAGQLDIADPFQFARNLGADDRVLHRFADDRILRHRLHRRITRHLKPHKAGQRAGYRNGQREVLAGDDLAIGRVFAAARDHAIRHRHRAAGHAKAPRGQFQHGFAGVSGRLAQVGQIMHQQAEGAAAIRRAVGIARDDRGDRRHRHRHLLGHDLAIGGVDRALAKIAFAGADQHGRIGVDLDPAGGTGGVERIARGACRAWRHANRHDQRAARRHKAAPVKLGAVDGQGFVLDSGGHFAPPSAINCAARWVPSRIAA